MPAKSGAKTANKTRTTSVVEEVSAHIRAGIKEGLFVPGQRLVEASLTEALGISRGSLREAMWHLAGEGLVTIEANKGVSVRGVSREQARDIYRVREVLEGLAASLAAERIDDSGHRARLETLWAKLVKAHAGEDVNDYMEANEAFHNTIVDLGGNEELRSLISDLSLPLFRLQFRSRIKARAMDNGHKEHEAIYQAILDGNSARAEKAMSKHVQTSWKLVKDLPDLAFS